VQRTLKPFPNVCDLTLAVAKKTRNCSATRALNKLSSLHLISPEWGFQNLEQEREEDWPLLKIKSLSGLYAYQLQHPLVVACTNLTLLEISWGCISSELLRTVVSRLPALQRVIFKQQVSFTQHLESDFELKSPFHLTLPFAQ
jgi:hypothetical protein